MKEIQPLGELTERADPELLKQLIHWLANKDPIVRRVKGAGPRGLN